MPVFDFLKSCAFRYQGFICVTWAEVLVPVFAVLAIAARGLSLARRDRRLFRKARRFLLRATFAFTVAGGSIAAALQFLMPDLVSGPDAEASAQTLQLIGLGSFGCGLALLAGAASFAFGGWIAKRFYPGQGRTAPQGLLIAIDGPAASGKGTLAKRIAAHYELPFLDTGLLYRAVARDTVKRGSKPEDERAAIYAAHNLDPKTFDDPALRGPSAGDAASVVAKVPAVRAALLDYQRTFAYQRKGAVLDGRDIGTVICPNATVKIFVTATAEERARRRHGEYEMRGEPVAYDQVLEDIRARDARDQSRENAPLAIAADAVTIDTTKLDAEQVFKAALKVINGKVGHKSPV